MMPRQTVSALPSLKEVYERVARLRGAVIQAEMVRPSSVPMTFKIAPGGFFYAKYPTSEMYVSPREQVTWLPAKKEFTREKPEEGNPLPGGFEILWPGGALLIAEGVAKQASFAGKPAVEVPCKAAAGHKVLLYVHPESLLPLGTIATAQGTEYELRYLSVVETPLSARELTFVAPQDARPFSGPPDPTKLIKAGASLPRFQGTDFTGRPLSSAALAKGSKGLVLNFWFSACTGCVQELPYLAKLALPLRSQKIVFLGVNPIDKNADAQRTSTTHRLSYPTLVGASAKKLADSVGVMTYPVTIVVDARGTVVEAILGFDEARLLSALHTLGYPTK
jgi:thiol-disulfide isomerase/thioredoxin